MFDDAGLFLGPTSLDWCLWGDRQLAGMRLEPVNRHRLLRGSYFQPEHLGTRVQHAVWAGVDWSQRGDGATSPHIHVGGLLQLLGDGDVGGGYSCIGTWLARRRRIH